LPAAAERRRHSTGALVSERVDVLNAATRRAGSSAATERPTSQRDAQGKPTSFEAVVSERTSSLDFKPNFLKELENPMHTATPIKVDESQRNSDRVRREGSHRRQNSRPRKSTDSDSLLTQFSKSSVNSNLTSSIDADMQLTKEPTGSLTIADAELAKEPSSPGIARIGKPPCGKLRKEISPSTYWNQLISDLLKASCCTR
jgi:hypothetical protein